MPSSSKVSLTCNLLTTGLFTNFLLCLCATYLFAFEYACMSYRLATLYLKSIPSTMATISIKVQGRKSIVLGMDFSRLLGLVKSVPSRHDMHVYPKAHKYVVYRQRRNFVNRPAVNKMHVNETFDDEGKSTLLFSLFAALKVIQFA